MPVINVGNQVVDLVNNVDDRKFQLMIRKSEVIPLLQDQFSVCHTINFMVDGEITRSYLILFDGFVFEMHDETEENSGFLEAAITTWLDLNNMIKFMPGLDRHPLIKKFLFGERERERAFFDDKTVIRHEDSSIEVWATHATFFAPRSFKAHLKAKGCTSVNGTLRALNKALPVDNR